MDFSAVPAAFRPKLKLFLSADIIGSTAYKQPLDMANDRAGDHLRWARTIQAFYKTIPDTYASVWQDATSLLLNVAGSSSLFGDAPRIWKTIGDEVVFWKEVTDTLQIWLTLSCWMKTIERVRAMLADAAVKDLPVLDLKSTVWVAGFPVRNKTVLDLGRSAMVPDVELMDAFGKFYADGESTIGDFIGPGIDIGFRLSSFSSSRKMFVSLDVAYLLARSKDRMKALDLDASAFFPDTTGSTGATFPDRLCVHYSGSEPLKGVLGGIKYPKLWISTIRHGSFDDARVKLYAPDGRQAIDWSNLRAFCEKFYEDRKKFLSRPFVVGDRDSGELPDRYAEFFTETLPASLRPVVESDQI